MGDFLPGKQSLKHDFKNPSKPRASATEWSQHPDPYPLTIKTESWLEAEKTTRKIIRCIRPTQAAEDMRMAVIDYIRHLIKYNFGAEVYPFGSVPLKTYLPDGDIDLTTICSPDCEETLANDLYSILQFEEQNLEAEFEVKDAHIIPAEVKLVKCLVQNISVDISFNQIGGLSTLCFLEKVDHMIGKDHLFKTSVALIKAWCYYESRILGAHSGLISTYALETLVLYIFQLFHSSLDGPLVVLYRFLDYFSKFDWDNYCISLHGPVLLSSMPELVVKKPEGIEENLLLTEEILRKCVESFSVTSPLANNQKFPQKHLNIMDLLKENNNLGRSINRGNFCRIRSAFAYGAKTLDQILILPQEFIADELINFFTNIVERFGSGERSDVQNSSSFGEDGFIFDQSGLVCNSTDIFYGALYGNMNSLTSSGFHKEQSLAMQPGNRPSSFYQGIPVLPGYTDNNNYAFSVRNTGISLDSEATDIVMSEDSICRIAAQSNKPPLTAAEMCLSRFGKARKALNLTVPSQLHQNHIANKNRGCLLHSRPTEDVRLFSRLLSDGVESPDTAASSLPVDHDMQSKSEEDEKNLPVLSGNYFLQYKNLFYARCIYSCLTGQLLMHPIYQPLFYPYQRESSRIANYTRNGSQNVDGTVHGLSFCPSPSDYLSRSSFSAICHTAAAKSSCRIEPISSSPDNKSHKKKSTTNEDADMVDAKPEPPKDIAEGIPHNNIDRIRDETSDSKLAPQKPVPSEDSNKLTLPTSSSKSSSLCHQTKQSCDASCARNGSNMVNLKELISGQSHSSTSRMPKLVTLNAWTKKGLYRTETCPSKNIKPHTEMHSLKTEASQVISTARIPPTDISMDGPSMENTRSPSTPKTPVSSEGSDNMNLLKDAHQSSTFNDECKMAVDSSHEKNHVLNINADKFGSKLSSFPSAGDSSSATVQVVDVKKSTPRGTCFPNVKHWHTKETGEARASETAGLPLDSKNFPTLQNAKQSQQRMSGAGAARANEACRGRRPVDSAKISVQRSVDASVARASKTSGTPPESNYKDFQQMNTEDVVARANEIPGPPLENAKCYQQTSTKPSTARASKTPSPPLSNTTTFMQSSTGASVAGASEISQLPLDIARSFLQNSMNSAKSGLSDINRLPQTTVSSEASAKPKLNKVPQSSFSSKKQCPLTGDSPQRLTSEARSFACVTLGHSSVEVESQSDAEIGWKGERDSKTYLLKDENEFPPLNRLPVRYDTNFPPLTKPKPKTKTNKHSHKHKKGSTRK